MTLSLVLFHSLDRCVAVDRILSVLYLTLDVVPLLTFAALEPVHPISVTITLISKVDLTAVITFLVGVIALMTVVTEPDHLLGIFLEDSRELGHLLCSLGW